MLNVLRFIAGSVGVAAYALCMVLFITLFG
jgi:hypothetical protein